MLRLGSLSVNASERHRAFEFLKILKKINGQVSQGLNVNIIMDNYATHNAQNHGVAEGRSSEVSTLPLGSSKPISLPSKSEALQFDQVRRPDFGFRQTRLPQNPADLMCFIAFDEQ